MLANKQDKTWKSPRWTRIFHLIWNVKLWKCMLGCTALSLSDLTSKHIHQIWDQPTDHTKKKVSKKELGCPPDQPERTTKRHVLICVCWTCLSHTRTGRGPCFPSALPFSYTVVFQPIPPAPPPPHTTHPIRKAAAAETSLTNAHRDVHADTHTQHGPRRKINAEKTLFLFLWCGR